MADSDDEEMLFGDSRPKRDPAPAEEASEEAEAAPVEEVDVSPPKQKKDLELEDILFGNSNRNQQSSPKQKQPLQN